MSDPSERGNRLKNAVGLAILIGAFLWSVVHVTYQAFWVAGEETLTGNKAILRFAHWQLEGGIIKALDNACRLYEELHPNVEVQQIGVPERGYPQWVRTQLIGRTAPDLLEVWGPGNRTWDNLIVRYYVPITERIDEPNPYNAREMDARLVEMLGGDPAEVPDLGVHDGVPWRQTFIDHMEGGWYDRLQDYYGMPQSIFTIRIFANRDLLDAAAHDLLWNEEAGRLEGPKDLGTFFALCDRLKAYGEEQGETVLPIAGSDYVATIFKGRYWTMATWDLLDEQDVDLNAEVSAGERFLALATGRINLASDPNIEGAHKLLYRISEQFNPGFMSAKREDSVFMFAQQRAAMMATGSWEAGTLQEQVKGLFEIMVFDFPIPAPGQAYSDIIRHRISEAGTRAGFPMAITKFCRQRDLAVDFMHFLTSRRVNEWTNAQFHWFPSVRGASLDPILEAFRPNVEGIYQAFEPHMGSDSKLSYDQQYQGFISKNPPAEADRDAWLGAHYKAFITGYARNLNKYLVPDFERQWKDTYSSAVQTEVQLAAARSRLLRFGPRPEIARNVLSLTYGQSKRTQGRAVDWALFEKGRQALERRREEGALP